MWTKIVLSVFLGLTLVDSLKLPRYTPLAIHKNSSACIAENLRAATKYFCDYEGNVICLTGWSRPDLLCEVPVCEFEGGYSCEHGKCLLPNLCACQVGWDGPYCDKCIPMGGCLHGHCRDKPGECICDPGWSGPNCDVPDCHGCKNGCCHEPNKCICNLGWKGHDCSVCETLPNCKNGYCEKPFTCICKDGFQGIGCKTPVCRHGCSKKHGYCNHPGECICKNGWKGRSCEECVPRSGCRGGCDNNQPFTCTDTVSFPETNGVWTKWSPWTSCSASCGSGKQRRERTCKGHGVAYHGPSNNNNVNLNCGKGPAWEVRKCVAKYCPINGEWSRWSQWSGCSASCGTGSKTRNRICAHPAPKYGGHPCKGIKTETLKCFTKSCPIAGRWSSWENWGSCSASCGNDGSKKRIRYCNSPSPKNGGKTCFGNHFESTACTHNVPCPIDAFWGEWVFWSSCSKSCGPGEKSRTRVCSDPKHGGRKCPGGLKIDKEVTDCFEKETCAIDGNWANWKEWTSCSSSCGKGKKLRERTCTYPAPKFGGRNCRGSSWEQSDCLDKLCPIDGKWTRWGHWGQCSKSCGGGTQIRKRDCSHPENGGKPCANGQSIDKRNCGKATCAVDGKWSEWAHWTSCSVTCGSGKKTRVRSCSGQIHGGKPCFGVSSESTTCQEKFCPKDGNWSQWSHWTTCSKTCGGGSKNRKRNCVQAQFGGKHCDGLGWEEVPCNVHIPCLVVTDGNWGQWDNWGTCSVSCGSGNRIRRRRCNYPPPKNGGRFCEGEGVQHGSCSEHAHCPIDGGLSEWSNWSECTAKCSGDRGDHVRRRYCINPRPQYGGKDCHGEVKELKTCWGNIPKQETDPTSLCYHLDG